MIKEKKVQSLEKTVWDQRGEINDSRRKLNAASKKFERLTKEKMTINLLMKMNKLSMKNTRKFVKAVCNLEKIYLVVKL